MRSLLVSALIAASFAASVRANAAGSAKPPPKPPSRADVAFDEGKALLATGHFEAACRKFEESEGLEPAAGTRLNLAVCHQIEGKLVLAQEEFRTSLEEARRDARPDRERLAKEHLADIAEHVGHLILRVESKDEGLEVVRDQKVVPADQWNEGAIVDPGPHIIEARAPGKPPWSQTANMGPGETATITIPSLVPPPLPPPTTTTTTTTPPPMAVTSSRETSALVLGSAGVLAIGIGTYFGVTTFTLVHQSHDACSTICMSTSRAQAVNDMANARTHAWVADGAIGSGVVALAIAGYLFATKPHADQARAIHVAPMTLGSVRGAVLEGSF